MKAYAHHNKSQRPSRPELPHAVKLALSDIVIDGADDATEAERRIRAVTDDETIVRLALQKLHSMAQGVTL